MKIAIHYDSLIAEGGAERVVIQLANYLKADIVTSGFNPKLKKWLQIKVKVIDIGNLSVRLFKPLGVLFEAPIRFMFYKGARDYDLNIYCGFTSIYGSNRNNYNILYCLTPNRIIYDLRNYKQENAGILKRFFLKLHIRFFEKLDQKIVRNNFKLILSQSREIKKRVKTFYGLNTNVIYPPLDISSYKYGNPEGFYLTVGRLFTEKRIDLIIKAFLKMPDKKLIIVGDGPEKSKFNKLIKNSENIKLFTKITDSKLKELYTKCIAVIFMAKDEDYGLVPIEASASGKICIAANEGGCIETVINNKTGYLITPHISEIQATVSKLKNSTLRSMKGDCIKNARRFNAETSFRNWDMVISRQNI